MTDEIELKPCPFCGGKAHYYYQRENERIICEECGAKLPYLDFGEANDKLVKQWNTRPIEDGLREVLEKYASGKNYIGVSSEGEPFEFEENAYGLEEMKIGWAARQALKGTEDK